MNTVTQTFDSRSMPLFEPSTAPCAFSLWHWLGRRARQAAAPAERTPSQPVPPVSQPADQTPR